MPSAKALMSWPATDFEVLSPPAICGRKPAGSVSVAMRVKADSAITSRAANGMRVVGVGRAVVDSMSSEQWKVSRGTSRRDGVSDRGCVDDEAVVHVGAQHPPVRVIDLVGGDDLNLGGDAVLGARPSACLDSNYDRTVTAAPLAAAILTARSVWRCGRGEARSPARATCQPSSSTVTRTSPSMLRRASKPSPISPRTTMPE